MGIKFCSIDPSISCTALAILENVEGEKFKVIDKVSLSLKSRYKERWKKKTDMLELFEFYLDDKIDEIEFFVIENYSYGSVGQLADLGELGGLLKHYLSKNGKSFDVMAPSSVKKLITGSGRASKEEVRDALSTFVVGEVEYNNLDESDAVAIGISYALKMKEELGERSKS
jgi:crossover junction endodeoxyribonuclease RuvC